MPSRICARSLRESSEDRGRGGQPRPRRRCRRLPRPGETLSGATFARYPGGKGANQAVAASRLGAEVTFTGAVGRDSFAEEALRSLREAGVALRVVERDAPTSV